MTPSAAGRNASGVPRLLVLAPLRLEQLALGPSGRHGPAVLAIEHTGMAPAKAGRAARQLSGGSTRPAAVAIAGLGGALTDTLVPGDLVVADRLLDATGREVMVVPSAASSPLTCAGQACERGRARS